MRSQEFKRLVPLAAWIVAIATLVFAAGKIIGLGFLPGDDALRHAAKAVSGKPWSEILVMGNGFEMDPHPGWHAVLGAIHHWQGGGDPRQATESLVIISIVALMLLFNLATLAWFRWPEAWLAALLAAAILTPNFITLIFLGRPFMFTMAVSATLLLMWSRMEQRPPRCCELAVTLLLIAAAAWIHGSFYQLILPAMGLFLAGRWRQTIWFGVCWAAGSVLGASFTGHPWLFLGQCLRHLSGVFGDYTVSRQLTVELMPSDGDALVVLAVVAMLLWRAGSAEWKLRELIHPIFLMGLLGWVLGLKVGRFWYDWGLPAILIWMGLEFQNQFERHIGRDSVRRLILTVGIALGLFLGVTGDRNSRWTSNLNKQYLLQEDPDLAGWLPGNDGIIYSADMTVFFDTFFKNPTAPWRYALGYESALMQPDDRAVVRKVQWNYGDVRAYAPWVAKMRSQDRLVIPLTWLTTPGVPNIPGLEWHFALNSFWIGRLPQNPVNTGVGR
jgi:hypothetical protein